MEVGSEITVDSVMLMQQCDVCAEKNRGAALPQVNESVSAGRDQSVSAGTVYRQLHREVYYSRVAVHKPLITKLHLRVQRCKNQRHWCTEIWKKK